MKQENIIKKITINIGGTEVEVTPKQAKDLHEALGELLGTPAPSIVKEYVPYGIPYRPSVWPYNQPTWLYCSSTSSVPSTTMTYSTSGNVNLTVQ